MLSDEEKKAIESVKDMFEDVTIKDIDEQSITIYGIAMLDVIKVLTIVEKQSKEIEELKAINKMQEYRINEMDIPKSVAEQKERKAYIDGTDVAHELCNKYWEDKIKAIIEELNNKLKNADEIEAVFIIKQQQVLQSLLKEE